MDSSTMAAAPLDLLILRQENKKAFIEYRWRIKAAEGGIGSDTLAEDGE